jgi:hypothetical protein
MKVLIGCEKTGAVRRAFATAGWDAYSCDLEPDEDQSPKHRQCDILTMLDPRWDLMVAHPPCTYLSSSGMHWTTNGHRNYYDTEIALEFFRVLMRAPMKHICLENPVGIVSTRIRPPTQYVQPYEFGDNASKRTGLWLKNLPKLVPTNIVQPVRYVNGKPRYANQADSGHPIERDANERSRTFLGIAYAMAIQWAPYIEKA